MSERRFFKPVEHHNEETAEFESYSAVCDNCANLDYDHGPEGQCVGYGWPPKVRCMTAKETAHARTTNPRFDAWIREGLAHTKATLTHGVGIIPNP